MHIELVHTHQYDNDNAGLCLTEMTCLIMDSKHGRTGLKLEGEYA